MSDAELIEMVRKTQKAIHAYTNQHWFAGKTALFLFEIGMITEGEYRRVKRSVREV